MAGELPFVSVVVPVLNGATTIGECLLALTRVDYPADRREIVVVDNGSTDGTPDVVSRFPVRLLYEERPGPACARNRGIEACRGEVVAFTDADCLASTAWLRELVLPFAQEDVGGVAGEIVPFPPRTAAERHAARIRHLSPQRYMSRATFPFAVAANLAFRRSIFDQVGLLDPDSPRGGESTDFCTRFFRVTGQRLQLAPRAVVFHRHRTSALDLFRQQWGYGRGHAYLYAKYRGELRWGWRERLVTYGDLAREAALLAAEGARYAARRNGRDELEFRYFEVLRKLGLRLGFTREALARRLPL